MIRRLLARLIPARFRPAPVQIRELTPLERAMLKASLEGLGHQLCISRVISRRYENALAQMGDTINVRVPARFEGSK